MSGARILEILAGLVCLAAPVIRDVIQAARFFEDFEEDPELEDGQSWLLSTTISLVAFCRIGAVNNGLWAGFRVNVRQEGLLLSPGSARPMPVWRATLQEDVRRRRARLQAVR